MLLLNHSFSPRIRFVGELELEHAFVEGLEEGGELELEQAYVDFLLTRGFNIRAGMLLVPMGIINERHEPPVYHGVERPFVDTVIVPTTWFDAGAGVHGEVGRGFRYRAYAMAPLERARVHRRRGHSRRTAEGLRGQRPQRRLRRTRRVRRDAKPHARRQPVDAASRVSRFAASTRPVRVGGSRTPATSCAALETRGQFAHVSIGNAAASERRDPADRRRLAEHRQRAARVLRRSGVPRLGGGRLRAISSRFVRYENFDTQFRMPAGFLPLKEFDRDALVMGVTYYPDPDVAVKVDYIRQRNQSGVVKSPNSFNVGLGWWF